MNVSAIGAKVIRPARIAGSFFAIGFGTGLLLSCGVKPEKINHDTFQKENIDVPAVDTEKEAERPLVGDLIFGSALLAGMGLSMRHMGKSKE